MSSPLDFLDDLPRHRSSVGLHRMMWLRGAVARHVHGADDWLATLDAVKITGSNGKGSVAAMLSAILRRLGLSHGLYTSPQLWRFHERIRLDGEAISDEDLALSAAWIRERVGEYEALYPSDRVLRFEAITALALHFFARRRPRLLVTEAGIGGRYDSTRVVPGRTTALTSVDLEHTAILGATPELIAYDKADLCPGGGLLIVGSLDPLLLLRLRSYADLRRIELRAIDECCRQETLRYEDGRVIVDGEIGGRRFDGLEIALPGVHQWSNACVAVLLAEAWLRRHLPKLPDEEFDAAVRAGLRQVEWPGRCEKIASDPDVYVDVGHSPAAVGVLAETVRHLLPQRRLLLVLGVSGDKDVEAIAGPLVAVADAVICTRAWHRGSEVGRLEKTVASLRPELPCRRAETIEEAMDAACLQAREQDMTVMVAGGLFLAAEAAEVLRGRDPRALRFFF